IPTTRVRSWSRPGTAAPNPSYWNPWSGWLNWWWCLFNRWSSTSSTSSKTAAGEPAASAVRVGNRSAHKAVSWTLRDLFFAQVRRPHLGIVQQLLRWTFQNHATGFHHIAAMARLQRQARVLLDQQNGDAFVGDAADDFEDLIHHDRRQAHRWFVQQQ